MAGTYPTITISKLDAAHRQLQTAIKLWFMDGDEVSIHTLASAAYEIIHSVSKKRNPARRELIFDAALIKEEYRSDFAKLMKKSANFFKHADRDGEALIDFPPQQSEFFILFSILGMEICGERKSAEEACYCYWVMLNRQDLLTPEGAKNLANTIPVEGFAQLRALGKREFFETFLEVRRRLGRD